ncbi:MAG: HK97 gp10 family phage protein [Ignavibacteria bacterium]
MDRENSFGSAVIGELEVGLEFHKTIDYDRKAMRRALVKGAAEVRKEARRIVSRRAISAPGGMPGQQTGALKRAIGVVGKGSKGGWIKVGVRKTSEMKDFYPAFLFYGSAKTGLAKRGNFIVAALTARRDVIRSDIRAALAQSLVPR